MQLENSSSGEHAAGYKHHGTGEHEHQHRHAGAIEAPPAVVKGGKDVEYTCPMHPQIRQIGPGNCPICGMALEPVIATGHTGDSP